MGFYVLENNLLSAQVHETKEKLQSGQRAGVHPRDFTEPQWSQLELELRAFTLSHSTSPFL
jgi:hypothetical protein